MDLHLLQLGPEPIAVIQYCEHLHEAPGEADCYRLPTV